MQNLKHGWRTTALLGTWIVASLLLRAQTEPTAPETNRAAQEAEQRVSLSAVTITRILRNEPGLLLAVKKALVRRAYEQGRLLDPADLTDDALFQLLHLPYEEVYGKDFEDMCRRVPDLSRIRAAIGYQPTRRLREIVQAVSDSLVERRRSESEVPANAIVNLVPEELTPGLSLGD